MNSQDLFPLFTMSQLNEAAKVLNLSELTELFPLSVLAGNFPEA